jgi:hypothetical protein
MKFTKNIKNLTLSPPTENVDRARICKCLWSPVINAEESVPSAYVAWRSRTTNMIFVPVRQAGHQFLDSLNCLQIRALN